MGRVYSYSRLSKLDGDKNESKLDYQEARGKAYYELLRLNRESENLVRGETFRDDGVSAWSKPLIQRPQGLLLDSILESGDHVLFLRMDRAFRSVRDLNNTIPVWQARGITVHFVDQMIDMSTANGKLTANILVAVAQWESDIKSERNRESIALRRENNSVIANVPYGSKKVVRKSPTTGKVTKKLVTDKELIAITRWITKFYDKPTIRKGRPVKHSHYTLSDRLEAILRKREHLKPTLAMTRDMHVLRDERFRLDELMADKDCPFIKITRKRDWPWSRVRNVYQRRARILSKWPPEVYVHPRFRTDSVATTGNHS